ncbi:MAG: hypothetical protein GXP27_06055, partial [Planctomycetes bacterium]|nr:hypothetical protein [Planctomycetota bacterium]
VVRAIVQLADAEPDSHWSIVITKPSHVRIVHVRFPRVFGLTRQPDERLAVPRWMGLELPEPRNLLCPASGRPKRWSWSYPGLMSLQCLAYYGGLQHGFYAACDDTAAFRKTFCLGGEADRSVYFEIVHYPENEAAGLDAWKLPYFVRLGTFLGDWFTAAERYRRWAQQQPWTRQSRLRRGLVPSWVHETGLWIWNRGRSEGVLKPAIALQQRLRLPVNVLWHWWHGCAYDVGFPEYFPPREGTDPFRKAVAQAHEHGVRELVYMNQRAWGTNTESWEKENAERYAVKSRSGRVHSHVYNIFTRKALASMCLATPFWREKYAGLVERAHELGVAGVYMDQACLSLPCYDEHHGHPLGGGQYWINGFRRLVADIRRRCDGQRPIVLAGEGCGEPWLPELDLMLTLQVSRERYASLSDRWQVIPFFQAAYHPDAITFGSYSSLTMPPYDERWPPEFAPKKALALLDRKYANQFFLEQARAFVWGHQLTLANFRLELFDERPEEMEFLMRLARVRHHAAKYLAGGEFLRPPQFDAPMTESDFSRLSIYAGRRDRLTSRRVRHPLVLASAWRAEDGDVGIALVNIADRSIPVRARIDRRDYGLPGRVSPVRIDESGRHAMTSSPLTGSSLSLTLPPRQAWVIEFFAPSRDEPASGG